MQLGPDEKAFLSERRYASLATIRADGTPQLTVMWYQLDGDQIIMNTLRGRVKDGNLQRDARAAVLVEEGERYLSMNGIVEIDDDPVRGQATIAALARRYDGDAAADQMIRDSFSRQHRVTLVFQPERVDSHGVGE